MAWRTLAHRCPVGSGGYVTESFEKEHKPAERICFDELVVDGWLHVEQMDTRTWWIGVGDPKDGGDYYHISVHIPPDGPVRVNISDESEAA